MTRRFLVASAIAMLFSSIGPPAGGKPNPELMLSAMLRAPLRGEIAHTVIGDPQPEVGSVADLLIQRKNRAEVIISVGDNPDSKYRVPWSDLAYNSVRNDFHLQARDNRLTDYPRFFGPVAGTLGTIDSTLATKLLEGTVRGAYGQHIGQVADLQMNADGTVHRLMFTAAGKTRSADWANVIEIRPERANLPTAPPAPAVVIVNLSE